MLKYLCNIIYSDEDIGGGSQKVRDHWEDLEVGGWTILKLILEI
jgi:hypothetical protein